MRNEGWRFSFIFAVAVAAAIAICVSEAKAEPEWIYYDSGSADHAGSSFDYQGVRFSLANDVLTAPLLAVSFYYQGLESCTVTVHITSFDHVTELVSPIVCAALNGWNEVDVSDLNIAVPHNFYVILEGNGCGYPLLDDEDSVDRSFKGRFLESLNTRMSHNLLIRSEVGSPLSIPIFGEWNVYITDKTKIRVGGHSKKSPDSYPEKWTLYTDGSFKTENESYGTWQQKRNKFRIFLDPEDVREDMESLSEDILDGEDVTDIIVTRMNFTWSEKKDGRIKGQNKAYAGMHFDDNKTGSMIIQRKFTGVPAD
jgi:hypothetical protein